MTTLNLFLITFVLVAVTAAPQNSESDLPQINWGECPQLEPTREDKENKQQVILSCLKEYPPPKPEDAPSREVLNKHYIDITACALKKEEWFGEDGRYKFDRALSQIKQKGLKPEILASIMTEHEYCRNEALETFSEDFISQVQLYQNCMDLRISMACGIKIEPLPKT
ncbi:uncharacterized protein LOC143234275 [Tachypleus tridentatus]|uniref:uncharacterized protein LOC143234275 n=1 Tax=Tachypleus tridentatus TaxID=6853 RepID=UPI003FCFD8AB